MAVNRYKYFGNYFLLVGGYLGAFAEISGVILSISKAIGFLRIMQTIGSIKILNTKGRLRR